MTAVQTNAKLGTLKLRAKRCADLSVRGPDFTTESTQEFLRQGIKREFDMPADVELRLFSSRINLLRRVIQTEHELFRESHAVALSAQDSIQKLIEALNYKRASIADSVESLEKSALATEGRPDAGHDVITQHLNRWRGALETGDRVLRDLASIRDEGLWFVPIQRNPAFPDNWKTHFDEIKAPLVALLRSIDINIGMGKTRGIFLGLLVTLVHRTTGQLVEPETVYTRL